MREHGEERVGSTVKEGRFHEGKGGQARRASLGEVEGSMSGRKSSPGRSEDLFIFFYINLPYLSFIHEKANCIAIFWTGGPHSLGSCHFRDVWATCLPDKGGGVPLSVLPKDTTSELAGLFSTSSPKFREPSRKVVDTIFQSLLV